MRFFLVSLVSLLFVCCNDSNKGSNSGSNEEPGRIFSTSSDAMPEQDIPLIQPDPPPAPPEPELTREELCAQTPMTDTPMYCSCYPQCCDRQRWYCPPNPQQSIDVMQVIVEMCDENKQRCEFGSDPDCPPPEIIAQSECETQWECPPGTSGETIEWFECQLEDGTLGRQQIICDKGSLRHSPCRPCDPETCDTEDNDCDGVIDEGFFECQTECGPGIALCIEGELTQCNADTPGEERCNGIDDDCDGSIDENQTNVCGTCGPVPVEECDGVDNDCDGTTDEALIQECETACGRGVATCSLGNWISCTAQQPADEECDGADNDCDGQVDEQLNCLCTIEDVGNLQPCSEPPLLCGQGFKTCECVDPECTEMQMSDCQALCAYFPAPEPPVCDPRTGITLFQEICNNFDEDCDQSVDEGLVQQCYTGDPETLNVGICVPGEVYCNEGTWGNDRDGEFEAAFCAGEIIPQEEICDGADNDCDGVTDYGEQIRDTDILFIVDWSGSMDGEVRAVRTALNRFAQHFSAEEALRWGLIVGPRELEGPIEWLMRIVDISPFDDFLQAFAALGTDGMNTSSEMLIDAIYFAIRNITAVNNYDADAAQWAGRIDSVPNKEDFHITWRPEADRILIVFTDELPQSFLNPEITEQILIDSLSAALNLKLYVFVRNDWEGDHWQDIIDVGRGGRFVLTSNPTTMYNDLMSIIDEACLPREEHGSFNLEISSYVYASLMSHLRYEKYYDYTNLICR